MASVVPQCTEKEALKSMRYWGIEALVLNYCEILL